MTVIVYGDFTCPRCYLASQRADLVDRAGTAIDWRAVEHDSALPATGVPAAGNLAMQRQIADVAALTMAHEHAPAGLPALISNTRAAVAAYAEAVSDGVGDAVRRRLFDAIWVRGANLSSAYDVRRLVTDVMWPQDDITDRLASPEIPSLLIQDQDLDRITRRSGGTVVPDGGPLTSAGWHRIRRWRRAWLALPSLALPAVIGPDRILRSGAEGLDYLADLAGAPARPRAVIAGRIAAREAATALAGVGAA